MKEPPDWFELALRTLAVLGARDAHATRQDDVCNDAPHSVHIDTNAAIALADAIEWYDTKGTR